MEGKVWDDPDESKSLTQAQRLDIKRAKVDLKIIKRDSSVDAKYDLFQRLNGYGSILTYQEIRSCLIIGSNRSFYLWLSDLRKSQAFTETTALATRLFDEQYDIELALRFIIFRDLAESDIKSMGFIGEFLTDSSVRLARSNPDLDAIGNDFNDTFDILAETAQDDAFRKYNQAKGRFEGGFQNTAFEVFALGLGHHINHYRRNRDSIDVRQRAIEFWSSGVMQAGFTTGKRADTRMRETIPQGRRLFDPASN